MRTLLFFWMTILLSFTSCVTTRDMDIWNADRNMRKLELGMMKQQVIDLMGKSYQIVGASREGNNLIEELGYKNWDRGTYILTFVNDELIEWIYEPKVEYPVQPVK
ncbi:MAG: DUF3192 domain-containing protein [Tannerellaceae bacterium]|nr:DUF3192 domain-containing protein [Tannerellaceae bacterium]